MCARGGWLRLAGAADMDSRCALRGCGTVGGWADLTGNQAEREVPVVEWWDAFYLTRDVYPPKSADAADAAMKVDGDADPYRRELITHLIQHPVPPKPPKEEAPVKPKEMFLTKEVGTCTAGVPACGTPVPARVR